MGEWELFTLNFSTTVLGGAGLRNHQKDEQRESKGDMERGKCPSGFSQKKKIAAELPPPPRPHRPAQLSKEPQGADTCSTCYKLQIMLDFYVIETEGELGILAPDSLSVSSSCRIMVWLVTYQLSLLPILTGKWPVQLYPSGWTDYLLVRIYKTQHFWWLPGPLEALSLRWVPPT